MMKYLLSLLVLLFCLDSVNGSAATEYDFVKISVNDHVITRNEIEMRVYETAIRSKIDTNDSLRVEEIRKRVVDTLIEETLLDVRANELMIKIADDQLDEEIDIFRKRRNLSQVDFEELLEQQRLSLADFRKVYLRQLRRNRVVARDVRSTIDISEKTLKKAYDEEFGSIMRVHARHILIRVNDDAVSEEVEKIRQKILRLKEELKSGKSFSKMADLYSEDPSVKNNHGDLGFFRKQDMVGEFSKVAFSLAPGTLSDPVRTPFGFHLIEVLEKKQEPGETFSSVKEKLYQREFQKAFEKKYKKYLSDLKQKARIVR